jgi:hypothetical protein
MTLGKWSIGDAVTIRQIPGFERKRGVITRVRRDKDGDHQYRVLLSHATSAQPVSAWYDEFRLDDRP